ncbi:MAG: hypothetical protein RLZZ200_74, partial [Pseudomonadota bacterium]
MTRNVQVGLLEDDPLIVAMLRIAFSDQGWQCEAFGRRDDLAQALGSRRFDVLVLDWQLPDGTAESIIRELRGPLASAAPILVESLHDDEKLIVHALEVGADDYVVKPLRLAEVVGRIKALLRRGREHVDSETVFGTFRVDSANIQLYQAGLRVNLTRRKFELASFLLHHAGELLSRESLLRNVWGTDPDL